MGDEAFGSVIYFLFTDIVGSSRLWSLDERAMSASLELHDSIVRETIERQRGYVFTTAGDAFCAAFERGADASRAAIEIQRRLAEVDWPGPALQVRIGVHAGPAERRAGDYFGGTVNAAARVAAVAHGGQTVMSAPAEPQSSGLPVVDLGVHQLPDVPEPVHLYQLGDGVFPDLDTLTEPVRLGFDEFVVDLAARELLSDGQRVHLEPQVFDVLACLLRHRDRLVSREELLEEVWGDQFVSLSALTTRIKTVRQALGDDGRTQRYVRTEHGRGYRFVGEVHDRTGPTGAEIRVPQRCSVLPETIDPLLGRDVEQADLARILGEARLVTIVGPGGMGKTRLSIDVARCWVEASLSRTAAFVPLDEVRIADDLPAAIATSLGIDATGAPDPSTACADWLSTGERLVVLDNCEHLLTAVADFARVLVSRGGSAVVLATSREPLRLPEERLYRLLPLPLPEVDGLDASALGPCVQLFADRARRVDAEFAITPANASLVVGLCRRLDGLPLAVELAASRLGSLGLAELAETLSHRLDAIYGAQRGVDVRHQSLRSTVEWSYRLLPDLTRRLFTAMARFPGGLRLADVVAVAERLEIDGGADVLLSQLVDASMVYPADTVNGRRYRMLETLRHFGCEQLGSDPEFGASVDRALVEHARALSTAERQSWTARPRTGRGPRGLRDEIPNLRGARDVLLDRGDVAALVVLSADLILFTEQACLGELWAWHDDIALLRAGLDSGPASVEAALLISAADRNAGRLDDALAGAAAVVGAAEDPWVEALAWHQTAMCRLYAGDLDAAVSAWDRFDELTGLHVGRIFGSMCLGYMGELEQAERRLDTCHSVLDGGHPYMVAGYHYVAGELARIAMSPTARESFERGVATCLEHDLLFTLGICRVSLVSLLVAEGDDRGAARGSIELIEQWLRSGAWPQLWITLRNAGELLVDVDPATALLIWSAADSDPQATAIDEDAARRLDRLRIDCRERCGAAEAEGVERSARRTPRREVVSRALRSLETLA